MQYHKPGTEFYVVSTSGNTISKGTVKSVEITSTDVYHNWTEGSQNSLYEHMYLSFEDALMESIKRYYKHFNLPEKQWSYT